MIKKGKFCSSFSFSFFLQHPSPYPSSSSPASSPSNHLHLLVHFHLLLILFFSFSFSFFLFPLILNFLQTIFISFSFVIITITLPSPSHPLHLHFCHGRYHHHLPLHYNLFQLLLMNLPFLLPVSSSSSYFITYLSRPLSTSNSPLSPPPSSPYHAPASLFSDFDLLLDSDDPLFSLQTNSPHYLSFLFTSYTNHQYNPIHLLLTNPSFRNDRFPLPSLFKSSSLLLGQQLHAHNGSTPTSSNYDTFSTPSSTTHSSTSTPTSASSPSHSTYSTKCPRGTRTSSLTSPKLIPTLTKQRIYSFYNSSSQFYSNRTLQDFTITQNLRFQNL